MFIKAIVENNPNISKEWDLSSFISTIITRISNEENFRVILEIFKSLIEVDSLSLMKKSMITLILEKPSLLKTENQETIQHFETSLVIQEILGKILKNKELGFAWDVFKDYFKLEEFIYMIDDTVNHFDDLIE